jgi:hypothetical protein
MNLQTKLSLRLTEFEREKECFKNISKPKEFKI